MSRVDLGELKRLDAEATPGPWKDVLTQAGIRHIEPGKCSEEICALYGGPHDVGDVENSSLIVAIRNALPQIIRELEAGRALAESVREWSRKKITRDYHPMEQCLDRYDAYTKGEG